MLDKSLYISSDEAAELLKVSKATLYAYVSRRGLRSFPSEGTRKRRYWRADIEKLLQQSPDATLASTTLVPSTSLTLLTHDGLFYRGRDVTKLSATASLEEVASLLWEADANLFETLPPSGPKNLADQITLFSGLSPLNRALAVLPSIEDANLKSADLSTSGFLLSCAGVLRWMAALLSNKQEATTEPTHKVIAHAVAANERFEELIRQSLVLSADHELDPTTYAVRAAANTGVTPYGATMVGLVVAQGQRQRHQRVLTAARFLRVVMSAPDPTSEVLRIYRMGESIPGFSDQTLHEGRDPRASALLSAMAEQLNGDREFAKIEKMITAATDLSGFSPAFILPVVFLGLQLGYEDEPLTFVTAGRMVGWLAHAREQFFSGPQVRPRTAYVGTLP